MNQNYTLLVEISKNKKIDILDLKELINLEDNLKTIFNYIDSLNLQPSTKTTNTILKEI